MAVTVTPVKAGLYSIAPETPLQAGMTYRLEIPDMCAIPGVTDAEKSIPTAFNTTDAGPLPPSLGDLAVDKVAQAPYRGPHGVYHQLHLTWSPPDTVAAWREVLGFRYVDQLASDAEVGLVQSTPFRVINCEDQGSQDNLVNGQDYSFRIAAFLPDGRLIASTNAVDGTITVDCPGASGCQIGMERNNTSLPWIVLLLGALFIPMTRAGRTLPPRHRTSPR